MVSSCRNMWRQRSFWARGWPAILQTWTQRENKHVWLLSAHLFGFLKTSRVIAKHRENTEGQMEKIHWPVDELLQAHSPLLDERLRKEAFVMAEWQLSFQGFARQGWYYNLRASVVNTSMEKIKHDPMGFCCTHLYQRALKLYSD